jgi:hypothetical protein
MTKGGLIRITKQPSDLLNRDTLIFQITTSEAVSQMVKDFAENGTLLGEASRERSPAHAKLLRDYRCLHPAIGEPVEKLVFHHAPQSRGRLPFGEQIVGMRPQDLEKMAILGPYSKLHDTLR